MWHLKDFLSGLPEAFNKNENSNIRKLITIISDQMDAIKDALLTTEAWRSIDEAEGTTLDLLGDDNNLKRGKYTDSAFRIIIRGKQARVNSDATINKIIQAIAATLNRPLTDIKIKNGYEIPENKNAFLVITIIRNPNNYEMPLDQLESVVSGGIGIHWEYVLETDYELSQTYSKILYPFEFYCGWMTPDGQQQTNGNLDMLSSFELSQNQAVTLQSAYPIAGDYEQINDNAAILNQFENSSLNSVMLQDSYMICGDNNINEDVLSNFTLSMSNSVALQDSYPICGTFVAGEVV